MAVGMTVLLASCGTVPKDISYFQGIETLTEEQKAKFNTTYEPVICPDDILIINVTSPDIASVERFTLPAYSNHVAGVPEISDTKGSDKLFTYLVDKDGYIAFPELGRIKIGGMSILEANKMLEEKIRPKAPKAIVSVQITNFKVSIMGEVKTANVYEIQGNRVTILDLIAMAGDMTIYGNRKNVLVVRDDNGKKSFQRLDLTKPDVFASPYFYLRQNDLVYVEPNDAQKKFSGYTQETSYKPSLIISIISGSVSVITVVASTITTINLIRK